MESRGMLTCLIFIVLMALDIAESQNFICSSFRSPLLLKATSENQPIDFPPYKGNQNCKWIITTSQPDHVIKFKIIRRQLEGKNIHGVCVSDYINIYNIIDENFVFFARVCGSDDDPVIFKSSHRSMVVEFVSNKHYNFRGFYAEYSSVSKEDKLEDKHISIGLLFGLVSAGLILIFIFCVVIILFRVRKRKEFERQQQTNRRLNASPSLTHAMSPLTSLPDTSSFVPIEHGTSFTEAPTGGPRPSTPPPAYDDIVNQPASAATMHSAICSPPSYNTVLRESQNLESREQVPPR